MISTPLRSLRLALPLLLALSPLAHAQQKHAPLQERMSYAQFKQMGLDKLSPAQLEALNAWLDSHGDAGPALDAPRSVHANTASTADASVYHSTLKGTFRGWSYGTVFTLANGQRWKVTDSESLSMHSIRQPKVTVTRGFLGSWLFSVDGVHESARVVPMH